MSNIIHDPEVEPETVPDQVATTIQGVRGLVGWTGRLLTSNGYDADAKVCETISGLLDELAERFPWTPEVSA